MIEINILCFFPFNSATGQIAVAYSSVASAKNTAE